MTTVRRYKCAQHQHHWFEQPIRPHLICDFFSSTVSWFSVNRIYAATYCARPCRKSALQVASGRCDCHLCK